MFSVSLGQHINLVPGLHNIAGRTQGYRSTKKGAVQGSDALHDAVRRLDGLSKTEKEMLSTQSSKILNGLLGLEPSNIKSEKLDWDSIFQLAAESVQTGSVKLSPEKKCFMFSEQFLETQSPFLINARGFKTRSSNTDKPFVKSKSSEAEADDSYADVLKHLNISPAEKEKVTIALSMASAAGSKKTEDTKTDNNATKGKNKFLNFGGSNNQGGGRFWMFLSKTATILIILSTLIALSQFFQIGYGFRIGKGTNEIAPEDIDVTFDDVKGCDEAKKELEDVVEFLMNPDKFSALGCKLPNGVLLCGPPGVGKTLLARAVAGQAGVPFFHTNGSEFDEVLVGQGARRIRDLFKAAKEKAPCVIFIDEIDSVGGKRTSSTLHPYANQTINQLLSEMDGFISNEGVIVLGATNRASDLDKALLRPGRFDTQVQFNNPDVKGRTEILELYLGKIKHDSSVNIEVIAKKTMGFSGADLMSLVNTAAIKAAIDGKEWVTNTEFDYAYDKQTMGVDIKSRVRPKEDLNITAYHEAGHTLVAYYTQEAMPIHKVTIVAKGGSGGHTAFVPPEGMEWHQTKAQLKARMDTSMGGRAAEELIFGKEKITGGASADLQSATEMSVQMVTQLGMSEKFGNRVLHNEKYDSPGNKELVDGEIKVMLDESYKRAMNVLVTHKSELHMLAENLLKYETLDADDIKSIIEHKKPPTSKLSKAKASSLIKSGLQQIPPVPGLPGLGVSAPPIESMGSRKDGPISS